MSEQLEDVFKALADSSRRKLIDQLKAVNGQTLSLLCAHVDISRQGESYRRKASLKKQKA